MAKMSHAGEKEVVGVGDVGWRADPRDGVAEFLDGVDQGADVAGDVVEEVHCSFGRGFGGWGGSHGGGTAGEGRWPVPREMKLDSLSYYLQSFHWTIDVLRGFRGQMFDRVSPLSRLW